MVVNTETEEYWPISNTTYDINTGEQCTAMFNDDNEVASDVHSDEYTEEIDGDRINLCEFSFSM